MPYETFFRNGKYWARNTRNGKMTGYSSAEKRANGIRVREAYSHGWKPKKGLAAASKGTRTRVASLGGKSHG